MRRIYEKQVNLKDEIEKYLVNHTPAIDQEFIHRVLAFSLSGTDIVDLHFDEDDEDSQLSQKQPYVNQTYLKFQEHQKIANRLSKGLLTNLLTQLVFSKRKIDQTTYETDKQSKDKTLLKKRNEGEMDIKDSDKIVLSNGF